MPSTSEFENWKLRILDFQKNLRNLLMESIYLSLIITVVFSLLMSLPLLFLVLRLLKVTENQTEYYQSEIKGLIVNHQESQDLLISNHQGSLEAISGKAIETILKSTTSLTELTDKTLGMLGTKDPIAFQQVQAMNSVSTNQEPVDNSDHGETLQWLEGQELTAHEKEMFSGYSEI